jgi:uncharacterized protein YlxP (DUF503 family)
VYVLALDVELHLPSAGSLKAKRAVLRPLLEGCRRRFGADAAEVEHQDLWQRAGVGIAVVAPSAAHAEDRMAAIERWLWSGPDYEVCRCERHWLEVER